MGDIATILGDIATNIVSNSATSTTNKAIVSNSATSTTTKAVFLFCFPFTNGQKLTKKHVKSELDDCYDLAPGVTSLSSRNQMKWITIK